MKLRGRLEIAAIILEEVSRGPIRRIDLEKRVLRAHDVSYSCFSNLFDFLLVDGNIEKVSQDKFAPFQVTEKGKAFLAWRSKT